MMIGVVSNWARRVVAALRLVAQTLETWASRPMGANAKSNDAAFSALAARFPGAPNHWLRYIAERQTRLAEVGTLQRVPRVPRPAEPRAAEPRPVQRSPAPRNKPRAPLRFVVAAQKPPRPIEFIKAAQPSKRARPHFIESRTAERSAVSPLDAADRSADWPANRHHQVEARRQHVRWVTVENREQPFRGISALAQEQRVAAERALMPLRSIEMSRKPQDPAAQEYPGARRGAVRQDRPRSVQAPLGVPHTKHQSNPDIALGRHVAEPRSATPPLRRATSSREDARWGVPGRRSLNHLPQPVLDPSHGHWPELPSSQPDIDNAAVGPPDLGRLRAEQDVGAWSG
jgi:hypothetical protein